MKYLLPLLIILSACGSQPKSTANLPGAPSELPAQATPTPSPEAIASPSPSPSASASPTPVARAYTHSNGESFCDSNDAGIECWGKIAFHRSAPVYRLVMGRDGVCFSESRTDAEDTKCYSETLGPIQMSADEILPYNSGNSSTTQIFNNSVDDDGKLCFKVAVLHDNIVNRFTTVCGFEVTNEGGVK